MNEPFLSMFLQHPAISCICIDLGDWEKAREVLETIEPVDLLVNNAGISILDPFLETPESHIDEYVTYISIVYIIICHVTSMGRAFALREDGPGFAHRPGLTRHNSFLSIYVFKSSL